MSTLMSSNDPVVTTKSAQAALCLGALGVVFGDIGTSPLYTMRECVAHLPAGIEQGAGVLGVLSLIFWSLVLVVSVKYLFFVTKADNQGEGGIAEVLNRSAFAQELRVDRNAEVAAGALA